MKEILEKKGFISDMDGVIYHGEKILPGVHEFVNWMQENDKNFVFLTNSPERTPHELSMKLERMGLSVSPDNFYTSAMATAEFLHSQAPGCTAYVIGEAALSKALYDQKIYMNDVDPDYVVVGETRTYSFEKIEKAIALINKGAKLIGANPDPIGAICFSTKTPTTVTSYALTNGNDTASHTGRIPRKWTLYGSVSGAQGTYEIIDQVTNPNISTVNYETFTFKVDKPKEYQYYKIVFEVGRTGNVQFSEIAFFQAAN